MREAAANPAAAGAETLLAAAEPEAAAAPAAAEQSGGCPDGLLPAAARRPPLVRLAAAAKRPPLLFAAAYLAAVLWVALAFAQPEGTPAPDYGEESSWDALPSTSDGADAVPAGCGENRQADAPVDAFYVHPTSFFSSRPNAAVGDLRTNLVSASGLLQQASAFNGIARLYAPRYRQASQTIQDADPLWNTPFRNGSSAALQRSMDLAFSDVVRAFEEFLTAHNDGRPFLLAAHSQGAMHAKRLLAHLGRRNPAVLERLVAAYLP